jgi:hypothetical protein
MKLAPLHERFLAALRAELSDWRFVASSRHFRKSLPGRNHLMHVAFINHAADFDATLDVAVQFLVGKTAVCVVGASLSNIEGSGQVRYAVSSEQTAVSAALQAIAHLKRVGLPFLERYSNARTTLSALKAGGAESLLLSPIAQLHAQQVAALVH